VAWSGLPGTSGAVVRELRDQQGLRWDGRRSGFGKIWRTPVRARKDNGSNTDESLRGVQGESKRLPYPEFFRSLDPPLKRMVLACDVSGFKRVGAVVTAARIYNRLPVSRTEVPRLNREK